uniref:Uncharacterized protein n=1 Tax=Geospiza parvula TaxID=87175 RepID=A0A8C3MYZ0_GEOPR
MLDPAERCLGPGGRLAAAVCLGAVGSLGFCSNLLVLLLFWRFPALRSPINLLLLNMALSDLLGCALGTPLGLAQSLHSLIFADARLWFGTGIISLISLAVLSYERCCTMTRTAEPDTTNYRKAWAAIILSWTYSLLWTVPPLLGWSSYGPEGAGITCSVNWHSRDANNASYIICLFIFCLVIPFAIIVYSYGKLLCAVRQVKAHDRVLLMVMVMVLCFLLCWLPYAAVALLATFGQPGLISPAASIVPAILAKSSTVYNPIIYVFLNKQVRCEPLLPHTQPSTLPTATPPPHHTSPLISSLTPLKSFRHSLSCSPLLGLVRICQKAVPEELGWPLAQGLTMKVKMSRDLQRKPESIRAPPIPQAAPAPPAHVLRH